MADLHWLYLDSLLNRIKNKETAKEIAKVVKDHDVNVLCVCEVGSTCL